MSETNAAPPAAPAPAPLASKPVPPRRRWLKVPRWNKDQMWRAWTRWDAPVYTAAVAFGVPAMSYFVPDIYGKLFIAMAIFALAHLYWALELQEMILPVLQTDVVNEENANAQIDSIQLLKRYGAQGAVAIWVLFLAIYVAGNWPGADLRTNVTFAFFAIFADRPVNYGRVEWLIIAHTFFVGKYSLRLFNLLVNILLKAFPRAERIEKRAIS